MATRPSVWFYPVDGVSYCKEVTLPSRLVELEPLEAGDLAVPLNGSGIPKPYFFGGSLRVRVRVERLDLDSNSQAKRDLRAVENHLRRGGSIGFAADRTKALVFPVSTGTSAGGTVVAGSGNLYRLLLSEALAIGSGDTFVLESGNPEWRREELEVSSATLSSSSSSLTMTTPILFDRDPLSARVMCREYRFYPKLYLPEDQADRSLLTSERGRLWTFEAELALDPDFLAWESGDTIPNAGSLTDTTPRTGGAGGLSPVSAPAILGSTFSVPTWAKPS